MIALSGVALLVSGTPTVSAGDSQIQEPYEMYMPIQGGASYVDTFGACRGGDECPRSHKGTDILVPKGTPVLAVASGTVGWIHDLRGGNCCAMELIHDDGWTSLYIHLNNDTFGTDDGRGWGFAPGVVAGASIGAGQLIGWVGDSGNAEATPPHLHFELHRPDGAVVNPYGALRSSTVLSDPVGSEGPPGCDFDDDGYDDFILGGVGGETRLNSKVDAEVVTVLYGSPSGPDQNRVERWNRDSPGLEDSEEGDEFGHSVACGDINGDGFDDALIGAPGAEVDGEIGAGALSLIFGSASGLSASGENYLHQNSEGVGNVAAAGDRFGEQLAVGDFDGDGFDDLAVGAPGEEVGGWPDVGQVAVLYGSAAGFDGTSARFHERRDHSSLAGAGGSYSAALAAADFDRDGYADLAIGVPGQDVGELTDVGAVVVLYGSALGLTVDRKELWTESSEGLGGTRAADDWFGYSLATGDFNLDGRGDLAVGVPGDDSGAFNAGAVYVLYGTSAGLQGREGQQFLPGVGGATGHSVVGDTFGALLAVGDFDGDGNHDLTVGSPSNTVASLEGVGSVTVFHGARGGLVTADSAVWLFNAIGNRAQPRIGESLGLRFISGDLKGEGVSNLAISSPGMPKMVWCSYMEDCSTVSVQRPNSRVKQFVRR